jgi:hypothetical protein
MAMISLGISWFGGAPVRRADYRCGWFAASSIRPPGKRFATRFQKVADGGFAPESLLTLSLVSRFAPPAFAAFRDVAEDIADEFSRLTGFPVPGLQYCLAGRADLALHTFEGVGHRVEAGYVRASMAGAQFIDCRRRVRPAGPS